LSGIFLDFAVCMRVNLVFPANHGIGDELAIAGPLVSALLRRKFFVDIWTFHPGLYSHPFVRTVDWRTEPCEVFVPSECDLGLYLYMPMAVELPLFFDRTSLVIPACRKAGWLSLSGDGQDDSLFFENLYSYANHILGQIEFILPNPPWDFLPNEKTGAVLLNLFGKGDPRKGVPATAVWDLVQCIIVALPEVLFSIVLLPDEGQMEPPFPEGRYNNLIIESLPFGSPRATRVYCGSRLIVTAEGGGYHLAYGAKINALLVTSRQWFSEVNEYALPPGCKEMVLFDDRDVDNSDFVRVAGEIVAWVARSGR
jgi:hypothetical protein